MNTGRLSFSPAFDYKYLFGLADAFGVFPFNFQIQGLPSKMFRRRIWIGFQFQAGTNIQLRFQFSYLGTERYSIDYRKASANPVNSVAPYFSSIASATSEDYDMGIRGPLNGNAAIPWQFFAEVDTLNMIPLPGHTVGGGERVMIILLSDHYW